MTECDGCGKEAGNLYCGHCREKLSGKFKKERAKYESRELISLIFWDKKNGTYRIGCQCFGCPANIDGICQIPYQNIEDITFHNFDGDNIVRTLCG